MAENAFNPMDVAPVPEGSNAATVASADLKKFIERRENLEEQKAEIGEDIKQLNGEVKAKGYDMKTFNEMIKLRKLDVAERNERESIRTVYADALGVFG